MLKILKMRNNMLQDSKKLKKRTHIRKEPQTKKFDNETAVWYINKLNTHSKV